MGKRITSLQTASSVSSTDYLPIDGNNGTKKISAGFINDIVTDVTVDGTSVVSNGTAAVSLSGKQDTLIAGTNITIAQDGKTISATDTTYSDMVGAGTSTAGTHGLVPAPASGDNTKFLRGDGTWQDVGGGGGSSTLAGLTDVSLSSPTDGQGLIYDATNQEWVNGNVGGGGSSTLSGLTDTDITTPSNGQILKYDATSSKWINASASGGGVVMTGATSSVDGTQGEAPQPLAGDQEKVLTGAGTWTSLDNIGTSQIYLGDLIPRVTSSDNHITASSEGTYGSTIWSAWGALTTDISIQNVPESNSAWVNANGDSAPWIMYYFDESRYFTEVEIKAFSNYGSDFSGTIYIEASNDASTWTDIGGGAKTINAALRTLTTNIYSISNNNYWRYIRIRGIQSFFELSNPACFFQSLQVKGGKAGGGIVQYIDFSSLSSQQVEDLQNKIGGGSSWTDLTAVLEAGETSLTITDSHITINGTYDFYTSKYGLNPLSVVIDDPSTIILLQPLVAQESELIVTATASTNWDGFEPWKAFANSAVNSGWIANGGSGGYWLQAEFPYKVKVSSIDFKSLDSNRSHAISRVSYSNDGDTFTDATLTSSTMSNNIGHADVSMSETAKYIRLCFDDILGTQTYPMVSQLELYGDIDSTSAGSMTITFEEQTEDINVKVRVS